MKFLNEMHSLGVQSNSLTNYDRAIDMINSAVEHHNLNDNFDAIADIDSLVQFIQGRHHDFTPALEQTVREIIADEMGSGETYDEEPTHVEKSSVRGALGLGSTEEQEEFRGGGKFHRRAQGPEFRGGGKRKPYFNGKSKRYEKYQSTLRNAATKFAKQEEQEVDNWSVDWDEEVEKFNDRKGKGSRRHERLSPPHGTSIWNTVMGRAEQEQEEVDDTINQRRTKRLSRDVSRTGTMRRTDPDTPFIPDVRTGEGDYRQSDPRRKHARLIARKARPHVEQEEDNVDWNKEVRDFQKRRKTYEPKYARRKNRLVGRRRQNSPDASVFGVRFESFKQFNEMYRDSQHGLTIDLEGPDGNAFFLLGYAQKLAKQLDKDPKTIIDDMKYSDYDHLLDVFDREFGSVITFINRRDEDMAQMKDKEQSDIREPAQDGNKRTQLRTRD